MSTSDDKIINIIQKDRFYPCGTMFYISGEIYVLAYLETLGMILLNVDRIADPDSVLEYFSISDHFTRTKDLSGLFKSELDKVIYSYKYEEEVYAPIENSRKELKSFLDYIKHKTRK